MKTPHKLGLLAAVLFLISHFLPAYGGGSGFACFAYCWQVLLGQEAQILSGAWLYYSGFVLSDILFQVGSGILRDDKEPQIHGGTLRCLVPARPLLVSLAPFWRPAPACCAQHRILCLAHRLRAIDCRASIESGVPID
jgi:hypothetical protein